MLARLVRTVVALAVFVASPAAADDASPFSFLRPASSADTRAAEAPPLYRPKRVTITVDVLQLVAPYFALTSELRLARRWSLATTAGAGSRSLDVLGGNATTTALELGVEPRYFPLGTFANGLYVGWSTRFARDVHGPIGFSSMGTPPGLATGAVLGFKSVDVPIITPDFSVGLLAPLVTPGSEPTHPPLAVVVRLGIGFSL